MRASYTVFILSGLASISASPAHIEERQDAIELLERDLAAVQAIPVLEGRDEDLFPALATSNRTNSLEQRSYGTTTGLFYPSGDCSYGEQTCSSGCMPTGAHCCGGSTFTSTYCPQGFHCDGEGLSANCKKGGAGRAAKVSAGLVAALVVGTVLSAF